VSAASHFLFMSQHLIRIPGKLSSLSIVLVCTVLFYVTLSFASLHSMRRDRTAII